jgi:DNA-binding NarL/FixJ family response regulator
MSTTPKWTEDRTRILTAMVEGMDTISQATVASASVELETTTRSISSKLRKMGYDVELAASAHKKAFTDEQADALSSFVTGNSGVYTYADIAAAYEGGTFTAKQVQGKVLSMELTSHVKPAEKVEVARTYSTSEEATFLEMVGNSAFVEEIAEALGKSINSVRGKALSFLRSGEISSIPKQKESRAKANVDALAELGDISAMTVEDIAESIDKTVRGVKTMLTRRGLTCTNHDGAKKAAKNAAAA